MSKTKLPEGSELEEIVSLYPSANDSQLEHWAAKYGYKNIKSFKMAMFERLGIKRPIISHSELIEKAKHETLVNKQLDITTPNGFQTAAVINDTQNPHHDAKTLSLVEHFLQELQPKYLFYNGDMNDFYQISKFDKNPSRIDGLQGDVNSTKAMFKRHRDILPNTEFVLDGGNHEDRWQKFLWTSAKELASLDCLTVPELFKLKDYGIQYVPYECGVMINKIFMVIHGNIASVNSSYTAKRMFDKHGGCGICGHTHRGGSYFKRNRFGIWGWWENFCLCSLFPDWIENPDWEQGFSLVHFKGDRFWVEQIPIINHKFIYGGRLYE